jgi:hypothetical protein
MRALRDAPLPNSSWRPRPDLSASQFTHTLIADADSRDWDLRMFPVFNLPIPEKVKIVTQDPAELP